MQRLPSSGMHMDGGACVKSRISVAMSTRGTFMADTSLLLWGLLFSSIGLGFFIYGRKQRAIVPLLSGLALMVFPYFVANVYVLVGTGAVLSAVPYFIRIRTHKTHTKTNHGRLIRSPRVRTTSCVVCCYHRARMRLLPLSLAHRHTPYIFIRGPAQ